MKKWLTIPVILSLAAVGLWLPTPDPQPAPTKVLAVETTLQSNDYEAALNTYRATNNLPALKSNDYFRSTATLKANELCQSQVWSHDRPDGRAYSTIFEGITGFSNVGENLAKGFTTLEATMKAWEQSPAHNQNMLGEWTDIGISSIHCDKDWLVYVVQHYGKSDHQRGEIDHE